MGEIAKESVENRTRGSWVETAIASLTANCAAGLFQPSPANNGTSRQSTSCVYLIDLVKEVNQ